MIRIYQGRLPQIPDSCYVDLSAQVIGDVTLGEHSSVWMNAVLRGDVHSIRVGANSNVQDCSILHGQRVLYPVIVGDWVTIVDPWPESWGPNWYETDDVYLDNTGDGYYLYDNNYPGIPIAVTVSY